MFGFIKEMFIRLLTRIVNVSNHTKCISLDNQQCMTQPTLINLHPNEYTQGLRYYPFAINLDRSVGSCNTLDDLSNRICLLNKTEDLNLNVFEIIKRINEPNILTKHVPYKCKCKFDGKNCRSNQKME